MDLLRFPYFKLSSLVLIDISFITHDLVHHLLIMLSLVFDQLENLVQALLLRLAYITEIEGLLLILAILG